MQQAAGHRPGAPGRRPQLQQHAGRAARGLVVAAVPAARDPARHARRARGCRPSRACRRSRSPACSRCSSQIQLKPEKVHELGVSPTQIMAAVQQANMTTGAGSVTSGSIVYPITRERQGADGEGGRGPRAAVVGGRIREPCRRDGRRLHDGRGRRRRRRHGAAHRRRRRDRRVAAAPLTAITRTNGEPSIGISVSKSSSGNTVDIANAVADALPCDLAATSAARPRSHGHRPVGLHQGQHPLALAGRPVGAVFAVIVIWVFLRSWRSTLIASLSIPLSVIGALIILCSRGESLNMLTLGGLTIAIGRVIDDSIVVIENIYRHLQEGDDMRRRPTRAPARSPERSPRARSRPSPCSCRSASSTGWPPSSSGRSPSP